MELHVLPLRPEHLQEAVCDLVLPHALVPDEQHVLLAGGVVFEQRPQHAGLSRVVVELRRRHEVRARRLPPRNAEIAGGDLVLIHRDGHHRQLSAGWSRRPSALPEGDLIEELALVRRGELQQQRVLEEGAQVAIAVAPAHGELARGALQQPRRQRVLQVLEGRQGLGGVGGVRLLRLELAEALLLLEALEELHERPHRTLAGRRQNGGDVGSIAWRQHMKAEQAR
mmetsp:Transcript_24312/g.76208  ORF Transcript_24312/g.76208 Transcript_24312/m.76208 type:complete len:226 (+) Transcript_24312:2899-3576(+)